MSSLTDLRPPYGPVRAVTLDATPKDVLRFKVSAGGGGELDVAVIGVRRSTGVAYFLRRVFRIRNVAGVITVPSVTAPVPDDNALGLVVNHTVTADGLEVNVTGGAYIVDWTINPVNVTR